LQVKVKASEDKTLKLNAPKELSLKPGESTKEKITLTRGKGLKGKVMLKLAADEGLKVSPSSLDLDAGKTDFELVVEASKEAKGEPTIEIIAEGLPDLVTKATIRVKLKK